MPNLVHSSHYVGSTGFCGGDQKNKKIPLQFDAHEVKSPQWSQVHGQIRLYSKRQGLPVVSIQVFPKAPNGQTHMKSSWYATQNPLS